MLRKIHSNRDPRDTIYSEIRKEFSVYFTVLGNTLKRCAGAYPRFFYWVMITLLITSAILSFGVLRYPDKGVSDTQKAVNPLGDGFDRILHASVQIRQTIALKHLIDSISAKKVLSPKDSSALDGALDRLRQINKPSK